MEKWITGETVEKVPKQILWGDAEKNDLTECARINDLTIMKGRETPKNQALTILKGFSTVSEVLNDFPFSNFFKEVDGKNWRLHKSCSGTIPGINDSG